MELRIWFMNGDDLYPPLEWGSAEVSVASSHLFFSFLDKGVHPFVYLLIDGEEVNRNISYVREKAGINLYLNFGFNLV